MCVIEDMRYLAITHSSYIRYRIVYVFNPLSPHDALKHHLTSLKTHLIFLQLGVLEGTFHETGLLIQGNFL